MYVYVGYFKSQLYILMPLCCTTLFAMLFKLLMYMCTVHVPAHVCAQHALMSLCHSLCCAGGESAAH